MRYKIEAITIMLNGKEKKGEYLEVFEPINPFIDGIFSAYILDQKNNILFETIINANNKEEVAEKLSLTIINK
jgi:hypothetical protein